MTSAQTDRETVERLERVAHWDGDVCACAWCGEAEAAVCIDSEPVCATCHTIAYERALIRDRHALRIRAKALEARLTTIEHAAKVLSMMAQTTGGTAGPDQGLQDAIAMMSAALDGESG